MFSHIMVGSDDLERSEKFYDAILGVLGFEGSAMPNETSSGHKRLVYMHDGNMMIITTPIDGKGASPANGGTIGFTCSSPEQVKEWHDAGVANGGTSIEDPPGLRDVKGISKMHLAYLRDPDGNKLCGLYMVPPEA